MNQRRGNWMQTYTGRVYWPVDPRPEEVDIVDIGHHLSLLCRYTGACSKFYSIAEHSVLVSHMVPPEDALAGLLHDAPEAYLNDMNRPLKRSPGMEGYRAIERLNHGAIFTHFGLPIELPVSVEKADSDILFHEQAALMPPEPPGLDWGMGLKRPAIMNPKIIRGWPWRQAKTAFMDRFYELAAQPAKRA
jgi:hypothetical protein